jgi:hypothetical protein
MIERATIPVIGKGTFTVSFNSLFSLNVQV